MGFLGVLGKIANPLSIITKPLEQKAVDSFAGSPNQVAYDSEGNLLSVEDSKKQDTSFRNLVGRRFGSDGKTPIGEGLPNMAVQNTPFANYLRTGKFTISPKTEEEQLARKQLF